MPYNVRKAKCKQSDGDRGSYTLSFTDKDGDDHRYCHTSRKKAKAQIASIEMSESIDDIDESWVPLAAKITSILEEQLAELAGSFKESRSHKDGGFKVNDRVRLHLKGRGREMTIHSMGDAFTGKIIGDNGDGTYAVEWDPLPPINDPDWEPEDPIDPRVPAKNLVASKSEPDPDRRRRKR